jgi:uncharacterized membrane protein YcaP (DUF421 family)
VNSAFTDLFALHMPVWELVVRGSAMYWFLFLIFRFVMRRDVGSMGIADVLLLVLVADASQNAMAGDYKTITEGMVLVGTIVGWNYLLDWASYRFPVIDRFTQAPPLLLVSKGRLLKENLRKEMLTLDDVMSRLRDKGVENVSEVKAAYLESDGIVTVITYKR